MGSSEFCSCTCMYVPNFSLQWIGGWHKRFAYFINVEGFESGGTKHVVSFLYASNLQNFASVHTSLTCKASPQEQVPRDSLELLGNNYWHYRCLMLT